MTCDCYNQNKKKKKAIKWCHQLVWVDGRLIEKNGP